MEVGERSLFTCEHLLLSIAYHSDGEIVQIASLESIRGDTGKSGLSGTISRNVAWVAADIDLVGSCIGAEAQAPDIYGGPSFGRS